MSLAGLCPRCRTVLAIGFGVLREDVCADCRGRFLPPDAAERVLIDENGISRETLRALIPLFASKERLACPACETKMSPVVVHGVRIDLCTGCGGVWCDRGELHNLTDGRYSEVSPTPLATPLPAATTLPAVAPGPGSATADTGGQAVFLHALDPLDPKRVTAAFAASPGLTEADAIALARHNNGVVVDGVSAATATSIVRALSQQGIAASAVDASWTDLIAPTMAQTFSVDEHAIVVGGTEIAFELVSSAAAGVVRRSSLRATRDPLANPMGTELVVVEGDDPMLELFALDPARGGDGGDSPPAAANASREARLPAVPRRFRVQLSTLLFGDEARGRERLDVFRERLHALGSALGSALGAHEGIGRGIRAVLADAPLPRYRSLRDLEREEAWLLWRRLTQHT